MGSINRLRWVSVLFLFLAIGVAVFVVLREDGRRTGEPRAHEQGRVLFGVLGDSDSAAYQDRVSFSGPGEQPGGAFHNITLQWPEVLARMRPAQVDLGAWAVWGVPRWASMARVRDALHLPWRGPRRETHQNNFAWASGCESLTEGPWRQAQRLVDVMDEQPRRWESGVVVIRSGVNNFGKESDLAALATNPDDPAVASRMLECVEQYRAAVSLIHERHPATRIVLVGIFNNANWVPYLQRWQSSLEQTNLNRGLDHFDNALRSMAQADTRLAFFDDRDWFARHWGQRDPETGYPNYRPVLIGDVLSVTNTAGDSPENAVLANLHAGLVWNLMWTKELLQLTRARLGVGIGVITDEEAANFLKGSMEAISNPVSVKPLATQGQAVSGAAGPLDDHPKLYFWPTLTASSQGPSIQPNHYCNSP